MMETFFKPTLQTKFNEHGNCLEAVIATLFDVDINDVPYFDLVDWVVPLSKWMAFEFGKFMLPIKLDNHFDSAVFCGSMLITTIKSTNPHTGRHSVISQGGNIIFDPMRGLVRDLISNEMDPAYHIIGDIRVSQPCDNYFGTLDPRLLPDGKEG